MNEKKIIKARNRNAEAWAQANAASETSTPKYMGDKGVEAYPSMPIQFGRVKATIYGGPFREYVPGQRRVVSVKMAEEIDKACDISIPTRDYDVPSMDRTHQGVAKALQAIFDGNDLYAGCMGGIGRTGLFMGVMAKVMFDYMASGEAGLLAVADYLKPYPGKMADQLLTHVPVSYVRATFKPHAIETEEQKNFVAAFDTKRHVQWLREQLEPKVVRVPEVTVRTVEKIVDRPVFVPYWNPLHALAEFFGGKK